MKHLSLKLSRRILSLLVAAVIVLSGIPVTAADENLPAGYYYATSSVTANDNGAANSAPSVDEADDADTDDPSKMVALDNGALKLADIQQFYVASDGNDTTNNGLTPETAFATIAKAVGEITNKGEILIVDDVSTTRVDFNGTKTVTIKSASGTQTVNRGATGHLFDVKSGAALILENIIIDGGNKVEDGSYVTNSVGHLVYVAEGGTLTMNDDAVLQNNTYSTFGGGAVYVSNGMFIMTGGKISGNIAGTVGGGVSASGTFNMSGGEISGNTLISYNPCGGGVSFSNGTFTMTGGTISGNTLANTPGWGGGVYAANDAIFDMEDGTISGNTASTSGGGVQIGSSFVAGNVSTFNMSGGTISENNAGTSGGGVYVNSNDTLNMSGSPQITGNKKGAATDAPLSNVYLLSGKKINLTGTLDSATRIGVTLASPPTAVGDRVAVTTGANRASTDNFISDDASLNVVDSEAGDVIELQKPAAPTYILAWDGNPNPSTGFAALTYGYTTGSSVTYTIKNTGNQTVSDIVAAISTGDNNFEITTSPAASLTAGGTTTVTVSSKTGLNASASPYSGTLKITWTNGSGSTGITQSLSQTVNKTDPTVTFPTSATATYGDTLANVSYSGQSGTGAFTWTSGNSTSVGSVGTQTHNMTFTPTDTTNYNTLTQDISVTVNKATPSYTAPAGLTATYGDTLADVSLPSGFSWINDSTAVGAAGNRTHQARFTPADTNNYNIVDNIEVTVAVSAKATTFDIDTITAQTYTGNALTPALVVKDGGTTLTRNTDYTVSYTNNINAGTANVSVTGAGNYAGSSGSTTFTINKATYGDKTANATVRAGKATTNATLILPALPAGASYPSSGTSGGTDSTLISAHSISGGTLKFSTANKTDGTSATITIPVTDATNYNAYNVTVMITAREATDAEKVKEDLDALTFDDIKNANIVPNDITSDLTLIAAGKLHGSAIKWSSDKTAVIASNGMVTRQANDTSVILTATVTNGTASATKLFRLTVTATPPITGNISGIVTDSNDPPQPLPDLTVKIMIGGSTNGTVVGSTKTNAQGKYSFDNLPYAVYSLVVEDGTNTVTRLIIIDKANVEENVKMPDGNQNTQVEVVGDTPSVAVANLEDVFTDADKVAAETGSVEIRLIVEAVDTPKNSGDAEKVAEKLNGKELGFYLDAELIKTISGTGTSADGTTNIQPGTPLKIVIDVPLELQNLAPYSIIRVHTDTATGITDVKTITDPDLKYDSDLHTLTFEADLFSTYALAYTSNNPSRPGPPSGGGSSGGGGSSSGGGGGGGGGASTTVSTYWIEVAEAKTMAKSAKEQSANIARSRRTTITGIRKTSLAILADAGLRYQHDTVVNNAVQVRLSVDAPAAATKDILVSGYVTGDAVDKTKTIFGKWFPNKVAVISFDQQGNFGIKAEVAAKVDLSGMDAGNLYFYSYDKATNKYKRILTEYRIDSKGYLHFATVLAGSIVVSDRPLSGESEPQNPGTGGDSIDWDANDLQNPDTGGDGMLTPPTQVPAQPQGSVVADALSDAVTVDNGILKLESRPVLAKTDSTGVHITDAAVFNLDAPAEIASDKKPDVWLMGGLSALILLAVAVLWAIIPRKSDMADSRK